MPTIQEALQQAVSLQNQGRQGEAEAYYEAILRVDAYQPDALHLLGLIASANRNYDKAIGLIGKALEVAPASPLFYGNLGVVLRQAGRIDEAIIAYRESIRFDPNSSDNFFNLGKSLKLKGEREEAEASFRKSIQLNPKKHSPWLSLMNLYVDRKQLEEAIQIGLDGLGHCPGNSQIHMNLGVVYKRLGQTDKTLDYYRKSVALDPRNAEALCRLANSLVDRNLTDEALELVRRAQSLEPSNMHVLTSAGILESALGNVESAVQLFRSAIRLHPEHSTAYVHLAIALRKQGRITEALAVVEDAARFNAITAEVLANKAGLLVSLGRLDEAEALFIDAINERDGFRDSHANLLMCMQYSTKATLETILDEHCEWNDLYAAGVEQGGVFSNSRDPDRRLRIGFVSGDLGMHPVGYFTVRMFEAMNRDQVDTYVYSDRPGRDPIAARIEKSVSRWNDSAPLSDNGLYEKIRSDEVDILFDLAGHTAANRLMVFAKRAAPIQMTWAGYVGTTGLVEMDYLLADRFHVSAEMEPFFRESILRMPNGYVTYEPPANAPDITELPMLANGFITFAAMCNPAKVNPKVLEVWSEILNQVPHSRLLLYYSGWSDLGNQKRVRNALGANISEDRMEFGYCGGPVETLKCYGRVDVALDTFPYSGGLTTCEAMWMGVPTITMPMDRFSGRHSLSHLSNVGLDDFVAKDVDHYIELAIGIEKSPESIKMIRKTLRQRMLQSPLCDGYRFSEDFLKLMRSVWQKWCQS